MIVEIGLAKCLTKNLWLLQKNVKLDNLNVGICIHQYWIGSKKISNVVLLNVDQLRLPYICIFISIG